MAKICSFRLKSKNVTASLWQKWLLLRLVATHQIDKEPLCSPLPPRNWQKFLELSDFWKIFASLSNRNILDFFFFRFSTPQRITFERENSDDQCIWSNVVPSWGPDHQFALCATQTKCVVHYEKQTPQISKCPCTLFPQIYRRFTAMSPLSLNSSSSLSSTLESCCSCLCFEKLFCPGNALPN